MRKGILVTLIALVGTGGILMYSANDTTKEYYTPRFTEWSAGNYSVRGAEAWMKRRMANQVTGEIDAADVLEVRNAVQARRSLGKTSALDLNWENLGPDNIGGRTRAILIDKDDSNIMFAGSVSGGLFKSINGGLSWLPVNDYLENLAVVSIAQAPNGDLYVGTGEGMYYGNYGSGSGGILGQGMFKSTDGGETFTQISSTVPTANNSGADWASIGKIEVDPNNSNKVYAATNSGLRVSEDGGNTWVNPIGGSSQSTDMTITPSGKLWVKSGNRIFKSDGANTYTEVTSSGGVPPRNAARMRIAVAPQDENYVYIVNTDNNDFIAAYQSKDGGNTWSTIGTRSTFLNPHDGQADFDNLLGVSPSNKERIWVGGVDLFEWNSDDGWLRAATRLNASLTNPLYVHSDNHEIEFDPKNPNKIFIGNDGGIFKSTNNGQTWSQQSRNYITTQFYHIGVGYNGELLGGTQDNGTIFVDPNNSLVKRGVRTPGIDFRGGNVDGDGGCAEISHLNPDIMFKEMQYGVMGRSIDGGETYSDFFEFGKMAPDNDHQPGDASFSDFVTPFALWEKVKDPFSQDSVLITAAPVSTTLGYGNGNARYQGTLRLPNAAAEFVVNTIVIWAGNQVVNVNPDYTLTGAGTGTFDPATGVFDVTFTNGTTSEIQATSSIRYPAGVALTYESKTNEIEFTVPSLAQAIEPGDSAYFIDSVQSMFAVGLSSYTADVGAIDRNEVGGIWMTRTAVQNETRTPKWWHIGKLGNGETPSVMKFSEDGDVLMVGTNSGRVFRISNLKAARDSASTSVNDRYIGGVVTDTNTSVVEQKLVLSLGRTITSISISPNSNDLMIVTVGNYGNSNYVYYTDQGTSPTLVTSDWANVTGDLPKFPVYASTFNFTDDSNSQVLIGTDYGVWATEDITATSVSWTQEINGLANVPVFDLVQPVTIRTDLREWWYQEGTIYAATHGRGFYKTSSVTRPIGLTEETVAKAETAVEKLNIYPNPASTQAKVKVNLEDPSDVSIKVVDITGKPVAQFTYKNQQRGSLELPVNVTRFKAGIYVVTATYGKQSKTAKLVVKH